MAQGIGIFEKPANDNFLHYKSDKNVATDL